MAKIPFPTDEELFKMGFGFHSTWRDGFSFPEGYAQELKARFPRVKRIHEALESADEGSLNELLSAYLTKLTVILPKQVVVAAEAGKLEEIVDRARQAIEFKKFCDDLEQRYFPERIRERERCREEALRSWEY